MNDFENENILKDEVILNPWIKIWTEPRKAIRYIINTNIKQYVIILVIISGIFEALDKSASKNLGDKDSLLTILLMSVFGGAISGYLGLIIGATLLKWTGKWFGGIATRDELKAAIAWGGVPYIFSSAIIWPIQFGIFGNELFTKLTPRIDSSPLLSSLVWIFIIIEMVLGIYCFTIHIRCLSEVQQYSKWKAFGTILCSALVIIVPILLIVVLSIY